jgi:hypothetical protein
LNEVIAPRGSTVGVIVCIGAFEQGLNCRKLLKKTTVVDAGARRKAKGCPECDQTESIPMLPSELPKGSAPPPLDFPHFPNRPQQAIAACRTTGQSGRR